MKYIWCVFAVFCMAACSKVEVETYQAPRYVQFTRLYSDTMTLSFRFYPGVSEIRVPLEVMLVGALLEEPTGVRLEVDQEHSTAGAGLYGWHKPSFRANQPKDTVYLILKKAGIPENDKSTYTVIVNIEDGDVLLAGELNYSQLVFRVNNTISKPDWWTSDVDKYYLGAYSDVKYQTFIDHVYAGDLEVVGGVLSEAAKGKLRVLAIQFKNFLKEQNPPLMDGQVEMLSTVPVIGS